MKRLQCPAFIILINLLVAFYGPIESLAASSDASITGSRHFEGVVVDCSTGEPIELATITIVETQGVTLSDSKGRFCFDWPAGKKRLHLFVNHIAYMSGSPIEVAPADSSRHTFCLEERVFQTRVIEAKAERTTKNAEFAGSLSLDPLSISNGAVTQTDPLFALKTMPEVSSGADFDGRFSINGASPDANAFYLDGLVFPSPYHLGGLCSIYDPSNIGSFEFSTFPVSASMFSSTAAVVDVKTKDGTQKEERGMANLGILSSSVSLQRFFADDRLFASLMARRSYLDLILNNIGNEENIRIPNFYDVQSSFVLSIDPVRYVKLGYLLSGDRSMMRADRFVQSEGDGGTFIDWRRLLGALYLTYGSRPSGESRWDGRLTLAWQPYQSNFTIGGSDDETMSWNGGRYSLIWDVSRRFKRWRANVGTYISLFNVDYDINFARGFWMASRNENSAVRLDNDGWVFTEKGKKRWGYSAVYGEGITKFEGFDLKLGNRIEVFGRTGEFVSTPRLSIGKVLSKDSRVSMSCGFFARDPSEDIGNPEVLADGIKTEKAFEVSLEFSRRVKYGVNMQIGAFVKREHDLLVEIEPTRFVSSGLGRAKGLKFALEKKSGRLAVTARYAYTISKRIDLPYSFAMRPLYINGEAAGLVPTRVTPYWYTSPYETRHSFSIESRFKLTRSLNAALAWKYSTGRPYTPIGDVLVTGSGNIVASEGRKMSASLPAYSRLDLHIEWTASRVDLFVELLNLTNRANPFNLRYNEDYSKMTYYRMLPMTPAFGVKYLF